MGTWRRLDAQPRQQCTDRAGVDGRQRLCGQFRLSAGVPAGALERFVLGLGVGDGRRRSSVIGSWWSVVGRRSSREAGSYVQFEQLPTSPLQSAQPRVGAGFAASDAATLAGPSRAAGAGATPDLRPALLPM